MICEQYKKMNMLFDFYQFMKFIDKLDLDIKALFIKKATAIAPDKYTLNDEVVFVEFKNEIRPQYATTFEVKNSEYPTLIASNYITPKAKTILKNKKISYLDSYGNAFIQLPQLKVYVEQQNAKPIVSESSKVFTQAGAQLIFQLLQNPEVVNETVRKLAQVSNISVGSVSKIMNGLFDEGFLVHWKEDKKYQLIRKEELLEKWIPVFNEKVLPNYKIGTYTFSRYNNTNWKDQLAYPQVFWGGEPGAALLTKYLNPEKFTLFTTKTKQQILTELKLVPDTNGEITIYQSFWDTYTLQTAIDLIAEKNTAPPVLIYAQLLYSGNERNIETAQIIFDDYIKNKL